MPRLVPTVLIVALMAVGSTAQAADWTAETSAVPIWKAVFGRVEARDTIPARSRIGGTLVAVAVSEGSDVIEGQVIARIDDPKLDLQRDAVLSQIEALKSQLDNAVSERDRGQGLLDRGVATAQQIDALRTRVSVLENQIDATRAELKVIEQRATEGEVLAPISGRVIAVPLTTGAVVMPGEEIARIGGGGFFLRLAVPERHSAFLREGMEIRIGEQDRMGRLAKVYPQIENGRVIADVEVADLDSQFVNARVLVRLPVGETQVLLIPAKAVTTHGGLDFVTVNRMQRAVVLGARHVVDGVEMVEVLSGLRVGEAGELNHE